jgi:DNA-binding MarR family transcriptional regulator
VSIRLTPKGRRLVDAVTARRRDEIATIAANIPARDRAATRISNAPSEPRTISSAAHFDSWYGEPHLGRALRKLISMIFPAPAF